MKDEIDMKMNIINKKLEMLGLDWSAVPSPVMHKMMYLQLGYMPPIGIREVSIDDYIDSLSYCTHVDSEGGIPFRAFFES